MLIYSFKSFLPCPVAQVPLSDLLAKLTRSVTLRTGIFHATSAQGAGPLRLPNPRNPMG